MIQCKHKQITLIWFVRVNQFFKNSLFHYVSNCSKSMCLHPYVNGHHVLFFIYLDLHNQKLHNADTVSQLSERVSDSVSRDRLFALSAENMFAVKDKKRRQPLPSDLMLWKTNREKSFSPRGNQGTGVQANVPPFRMTPFSRHIHT